MLTLRISLGLAVIPKLLVGLQLLIIESNSHATGGQPLLKTGVKLPRQALAGGGHGYVPDGEELGSSSGGV